MTYENIPDELKQLNQWILWREETVDGKQTKIPYRAIDGKHASVNNPLDWSEFVSAVSSVSRINASGLGLVVTRSDPYCFVDLDDPNAHKPDQPLLTAEQIKIITERQNEIFKSLNSYSEISPSGSGLHIICKAVLPELGRRRGKIEIYDNLRFFTFTGNVYYNAPISERQVEIEAIYATLANPNIILSDASGLEHETFSDELVLDKCNNGETRELFKSLWSGKWNDRYQSQSEADFAIINLISFYSKNATQTKRLFLRSGLGQRSKAKRDKYIDGMVQRSFDRMPQSITIKLNGTHWFHAGDYEPWYPKPSLDRMPPIQTIEWNEKAQNPTPSLGQPGASPATPSSVGSPTLPADAPAPSGVAKTRRQSHYEFSEPVPPMVIPGLVGELVAHTWNYAVHQIAETAIASALSTMSLLCGRSYRHGSLGLSLYIMLLAKTSTGKDFAYQANTARFNAMINYFRNLVPPNSAYGKLCAEQLEKMVRDNIGSAQGLLQIFSESPSMLFHLDEYIENLRLMSLPNPPPNTALIKTTMMQLFSNSGPGRTLKAPVYSKRTTTAPELKDIFAASLTILAAGVPSQFYNELSNHLLSSGFIPRFVILDYNGDIPSKNPNPIFDCSIELINKLCHLFNVAHTRSTNMTGQLEDLQDVQGDEQAEAYMEELDNYCLNEANLANRTDSEMSGMWSRAKESIRKIAALIAIGVNPHMPTITVEYVDIAKRIVTPTINNIKHKVTSGQTGHGDARCEADIKRIIEDMLLKGFYGLKFMAGIKKELIDANMIQLSLLKNKCLLLASFKSNHIGSRKAFDDAINSMCNSRILKRVVTNSIPCIMVDVAFYDGS